MLSLEKVMVVGVDVRGGETGRGGGARSFQWIGNRRDFYIWETAKRGCVVNLREPAESYDCCLCAGLSIRHNPVRFARPSARRVSDRTRYIATPAARLNNEYR